MIQLSLFEETVKATQTDEIKIKHLKKMIEVSLVCPICGEELSLYPHVQIHSDEYMEQHWQKVGDNSFLIQKPCSSKCRKMSKP
jgi:hypothetical protein